MTLKSLRLRLVVAAAVWSVITLLIVGVALSTLFHRHVEESFDDRLMVLLEGLVAVAEFDGGGRLQLLRSPGEPRFEQPYSGWYWQIGFADDALRSRSLWDQVLPPIGGADQKSIRRGRLIAMDGQTLRILSRPIVLAGRSEPLTFTVAGDLADLNSDVRTFNYVLFWGLSLLGIGLILTTVLQVHVGLRPLKRIGTALGHIRSGKADRLEGPFPSEIEPLATELDQLLNHNQQIIERARTHVGNLAHALKTPLSVLTNDAEREPERLADSVKRQVAVMGRHVNHYLARARAAGSANVLGTGTALAPVIDDLQRALQKIHQTKQLAFHIDCPDDLGFRGEREDLEEVLGNLLDNACKWAKSAVAVHARRDRARLTIDVSDDGPGLAEPEREEMLKRGVRLDETVPGSGLGLSIVQNIAHLYGGEIRLEKSDLGGLRARIILPAQTLHTDADVPLTGGSP